MVISMAVRLFFFFFDSISVHLGYRTLCSTLTIVIRVQILLSPCPVFSFEIDAPLNEQRCVVPNFMRVGFGVGRCWSWSAAASCGLQRASGMGGVVWCGEDVMTRRCVARVCEATCPCLCWAWGDLVCSAPRSLSLPLLLLSVPFPHPYSPFRFDLPSYLFMMGLWSRHYGERVCVEASYAYACMC